MSEESDRSGRSTPEALVPNPAVRSDGEPPSDGIAPGGIAPGGIPPGGVPPDRYPPDHDEVPAGEAAATGPPDETTHRGGSGGVWRFVREVLLLVLVSVIVAAVVKTLLFQVFFIPSGSMEETLLVGDRVGVDKVSYHFTDVKRGEVIVFHGPPSWAPESTSSGSDGIIGEVGTWLRGLVGLPTDEHDFIKRVVGVGGDTVLCCDDAGRVVVNGKGLDEPYVYENTPLDVRPFGPIVVPEDRLFMLGDHRGLSADSRYHLEDGYSGTVPVDDVVGRAFVVIWPFAQWKTLPIPATFDSVPAPSTGAAPETGG